MADTLFFLEQASACALAAEETPLPKLREKYLAAKVAWESLALAESTKERFGRPHATMEPLGIRRSA